MSNKKLESGKSIESKGSSQNFQTPTGQIQKKESGKYEFTSQERLKIKQFLAKLQLGDLCFLDIMDYGIALFGETKAGKTTLAHLLMKNPLVSTTKSDGLCFEIKGSPHRLSEAVIGMTCISQTEIPNECETDIKVDNKRVHLLDCPGYSDSKGSFMIVTNGYFHYRVFSKVKNLKFVLTFDGNYFRSGTTFDKAYSTLKEFFCSFKDITSIKQKIFDATVFFFTKIDRTVERQNIKELLQGMRNSSIIKKNKLYQSLIKELIRQIIDNDKFFIFPKGERQGDKPRQNQFLQNIHQKTTFWSREVMKDTNQVDMSDIQIALGPKIAQIQQQDFKKTFELMCSQFSNRFSRAFKPNSRDKQLSFSFKDVISNFMINSLTGKADQRSYLNKICQFNQQFYIFDTLKEFKEYDKKQYDEKRTKIMRQILAYPIQQIDRGEIQWIQKLQISKMIIQLLQDQTLSIQNGFPRHLGFYNNLSNQLMRIIAQIKKIKYSFASLADKQNYINNLQKFTYIIYRLIQQAKTFRILFVSESKQEKSQDSYEAKYDPISSLFTTLQDLHSDNFSYTNNKNPNTVNLAKIDYITLVLQIKQNQSLFYYKQIQKYCKDITLASKSQVFNMRMTQISKAKLQSKNVHLGKNQKIISLVSNIRNAKKNLSLSNLNKNFQVYIGFMNDLGYTLSKSNTKEKERIQQIRKSLKFAIKIYKCVNNVHRIAYAYQRLIQSYDQEKQGSQLKDILVEGSQYMSAHGRRELALQMLEHAYHLIDRIGQQFYNKSYEKRRQQRQRLGQMIGFLGLERSYNPGENYYDSMIMKRFCDIIDKKDLDEIERHFPL